jgi:ABC-2 type transport system permease protein
MRAAGLRDDVDLYLRFVVARLSAQLEYRASFLIMTAVTFLGLITELVALLLLFYRFDDLAGWSAGEVMLLAALASISFGMAEMVGAGFDVFAVMIRRGELDQLLLRPAGVFTQVMASDFQLRRVGRISQGLVALGIALAYADVEWTLAKTLYLPVVVLSGTVMYFALLVFGAVLCFWTVDSLEVINTVTHGGIELTSHPLPIYHLAMQRFFTFVIPLAFVSYFPALYLLDRSDRDDWPAWMPFMSPVAAVALALLARVAWAFGVRHYRSTGS